VKGNAGSSAREEGEKRQVRTEETRRYHAYRAHAMLRVKNKKCAVRRIERSMNASARLHRPARACAQGSVAGVAQSAAALPARCQPPPRCATR